MRSSVFSWKRAMILTSSDRPPGSPAAWEVSAEGMGPMESEETNPDQVVRTSRRRKGVGRTPLAAGEGRSPQKSPQKKRKDAPRRMPLPRRNGPLIIGKNVAHPLTENQTRLDRKMSPIPVRFSSDRRNGEGARRDFSTARASSHPRGSLPYISSIPERDSGIRRPRQEE